MNPATGRSTDHAEAAHALEPGPAAPGEGAKRAPPSIPLSQRLTHEKPSRHYFLTLCLGALGVVYGDIGTSPLYAIRECFHPTHGLPVTPDNVLGVLSLIVWSLVIVVTVKYL